MKRAARNTAAVHRPPIHGPLVNPYGAFFGALPPSCRRVPSAPLSASESAHADWLTWKSAIARHFAWAVPTDEAIATIARYATDVVEIGAGSGYWAWLMRQAGITVAAFDDEPPAFTWSDVAQGDERAILDRRDSTLFLCWPPWGTAMAVNALALHRGDYVIYVGEWMGGSADARFFALLAAQFEAIDGVAIPQWYNRDDRLFVFRRRDPQPRS
ncbi:hypothetical protein FHP25_32200 [Vineibacter terrae]|uniref:Class I SAM-dependent methyltransferase n=1 Tax=Vineibacter terrae TaxID=2586908 RepID=A0A5C8PBQ0_9HYPH|nr:hypothetical protein [Vineibacter terrae]TXL71004.1 hypothetical protein FHP25_32200 [Vineibacter terrae]